MVNHRTALKTHFWPWYYKISTTDTTTSSILIYTSFLRFFFLVSFQYENVLSQVQKNSKNSFGDDVSVKVRGSFLGNTESWNEAGGTRNGFSTPPSKPTACSSSFWYTAWIHTHTHTHTEALPHHCHRAWKMKNPWVYAFWFLNQQCFDFGFATAEREAAYYLLHYWQEERDAPVCGVYLHMCVREFCVSV